VSNYLNKFIYILLFVAVILSFILPLQFLLNFTYDDSFFYIKIASNFTKGLGSTFDGVNQTNGYHPLYFILLAILFFIPNFLFKVSPEFLLRFVVLLHFIMIIFIQIFMVKSLKNVLKKEFGVTSLLIFTALVFSFIFTRDFGLESHLACLLMTFFVYLKSKEIYGEKDNIWMKSFLIVALFLTRTDYLFTFLPFILFAEYLSSQRKKKYILVSLSMFFLTVILYYFSNYIFWGNFETVSGKIQNGFPSLYILNNLNTLITDPDKLYNQFIRIVITIVSFVMFGIYYFLKIGKSEYSKFNFFVFCLGCGSVVFLLMHLMFNTAGIREWYTTIPVFISIVMVIIIFQNRKIIRSVLLLMSFLLLIYVFYGKRINYQKFAPCYEYAKTLNSVVAEDKKIYQIDFSGIIGFFSDRNLINGDGMVNSFEYLDYMKKGKINDYLKKYNVNYYSTYTTKDILHDSIYIDDNFSDKLNGQTFEFNKSSLITEMEFKWNHIAYELIGKWYLFKFFNKTKKIE
jgi:hypothetical protein